MSINWNFFGVIPDHIEGIVRLCNAVQMGHSNCGHLLDIKLGSVIIRKSQTFQVTF